MVLYFAIVGQDDNPLYETSLNLTNNNNIQSTTTQQQRSKDDLSQFIIHASLDIIQHKYYNTTMLYLKQVDKFNDIIVSAFVTNTYTKFILLHDNVLISNNDNNIKLFFNNIYEIYVKYIMSPFYTHNTHINNTTFYNHVKRCALRYLNMSAVPPSHR